jgi:hypothetical protein
MTQTTGTFASGTSPKAGMKNMAQHAHPTQLGWTKSKILRANCPPQKWGCPSVVIYAMVTFINDSLCRICSCAFSSSDDFADSPGFFILSGTIKVFLSHT